MGCIGPSIVVLQFGSLYKLSRYDVTILTLHNFTSARESLSEAVSNGQTISKLSPPTHPEQTPHPTWETKLHLPVPLRDKKESNESCRQLFFFNHLPFSLWKQKKKSEKKGFVWEGSKPRTLVVSENMFRCLYMSGYIFIWHVHCSPLIYSPVLPFFQYLHKSIKKSILNSMSQSILSISTQPQRDKQKKIKLDPWAVVHLSTFQMTVVASLSSANSKRGRCVWWGVGQGRGISPEGFQLTGSQASWHQCLPSPAGPASVPCSTGQLTGKAWGQRSTSVLQLDGEFNYFHYNMKSSNTNTEFILVTRFICAGSVILVFPEGGPTFQSRGHSAQSRDSRTWRQDSWSARWRWWGAPMGEAGSRSVSPTEPWKRGEKADDLLTYFCTRPDRHSGAELSQQPLRLLITLTWWSAPGWPQCWPQRTDKAWCSWNSECGCLDSVADWRSRSRTGNALKRHECRCWISKAWL